MGKIESPESEDILEDGKNQQKKLLNEELARLRAEDEHNRSQSGAHFSLDSSLPLVETIVSQEMKIEELERDPLTGLMNRRLFDGTVERFMEIIVRNHQEGSRRKEGFGYTRLGLVYLDVTKFKDVNDNFGHDRGDDILRKVADVLKDKLRGNDVICRRGGDEFVFCLLGADQKDADGVMEKLKEYMQKAFSEMLNLDYLGGCSPVSMGSAVFHPIGSQEVDAKEALKDLIDQADKAMYDNKKSDKLKNKWELVLRSDKKFEYMDRGIKFADALVKKYGNTVSKYRLYHILGVSTLKESVEHEMDFRGKYSIEKFILKCYDEVFVPQRTR